MTKPIDEKKHETKRHDVAGPNETTRSLTSCPEIVGYEIRVRDHLETYWFEWFEGWSITNLENGEVLLMGNRVDQSRLHGTLNKVRDLNLTLLSVRFISKNG